MLDIDVTDPERANAADPPAVRLAGLSKRYGRHAPWVLDRISLTVPHGSLFGLLGPNGAGKSTLIRVLTGLSVANHGSVSVNGYALPDQADHAARGVGLAPQTLAFYPNLSVEENLGLFAALRIGQRSERPASIATAVEITQLGDYRGRRACALSGGLQRRLNLAIALLGRPALLILDEPTVGVDPQSRDFILESLRGINREGTTVLYTTHYMDEVQRLCDHAAIIDGGRLLAADTMDKVIGQDDDLESAFLRLTGHALRES